MVLETSMKWSWMMVLVACGSLSCSTVPRPVPVVGAPVDLQSLTGEWSGDYHANGGGRQGTIVFKLAAGADSANGEVLMFPRETAARPGESGAVRQPLPQSLGIRFVRATEGKVTGVLDPYVDPDCDCRANTVFEGKLSGDGDTIEGTYSVGRTGNEPITGVWKVKRKKS
jgi:hypothetical protein